MNFLWIDSRDLLYSDWLALRYRILREPLGLSFSAEDLAAEKSQRHLIAVENDVVFGGLIVAPRDDTFWKVRQVAVTERARGKGLGSALMRRMESDARAGGVTSLVLHSREKVIPFYRNLGFTCVGDTFIEVGIPHRKMVRDLTGGERGKGSENSGR